MGAGLSRRHGTKPGGEAKLLKKMVDTDPTKGDENNLRDRDSGYGHDGADTECDLPGHKVRGVRKLSSRQGKIRRKEIWTSMEPGGRGFSLSLNEKNLDASAVDSVTLHCMWPELYSPTAVSLSILG